MIFDFLRTEAFLSAETWRAGDWSGSWSLLAVQISEKNRKKIEKSEA
jgi:hypothetical protein